MKKTFTSLFLMLFVASLVGQVSDSKSVAQSFLEENLEKLDLKADDISEYIITDSYQTKHNGVTHVYMVQTIDGIQVHNAMINLNITKDGQVPYYGHRFIKDLKSKLVSSNFSIEASAAVESVAHDLEITVKEDIRLKKQLDAQTMVFEPTSYATGDIKVQKKYFLTADDKIVPTWEVTMKMKDSADHWYNRVNAVTGEVVDKHNYTVYCTHAKGAFSRSHLGSCTDVHGTHAHAESTTAAPAAAAMMDAQYRVYPFPAESPNHGTHDLITNPHNVIASPYGWHDVNGADGAEYTTTRGNNVHAVLDINEDTGVTLEEGPDGGENLIFDFVHLQDEEPSESQPAVITNMFYVNNMMHDHTYLFGFDEAAGNFQANNYGNGGFGTDHVIAEAIDASGTNNASFGTPPDGANPSMNMFLWDISRNSIVNISEPQELVGSYDIGAISDDGSWGYTNYDGFDVTASVAIAFDDLPQNATQCCNDIVNDTEVAGKIALIDRGGCEFGSKARNAQSNGAVGCIICNVAGVDGGDGDGLSGMLGGADGGGVTIPTFMMRRSDCDLIRASINSGVDVVMTVKPIITAGPDQLPSSFDNGVIAHEFAHGISNRLTGGPNNTSCLGTGEQMGEGWSDLFSLFYTVRPGDTGDMARGIGTYVEGQGPEGRGIRRFPYSTDKSINNQTYDDIKGQGVHQTGEIWVGAVWDMYWAMVDKYGYDPDFSNKESGNARAIQLVVDGMKFQPCNPGFLDGRDAIIGADIVNNGGENLCLIWEAFAGRGLGEDADQGSSGSVDDGTEGFEPLATCILELKIDKSVSEFVSPGDEIDVNLLVRNHTLEAKNGVIVTDQIPEDVSYVDGSANIAPTVDGNTLTWDLGTMESLDELTITYKLQTSSAAQSTTLFFDDVEGTDHSLVWDPGPNFNNMWGLSGEDARSGTVSWSVGDFYVDAGGFNVGGDTRLVLNEMTVVGENPTLRFWHKYNTELGVDGGFMEISVDGGLTWRNVTDNVFRNGYNAVIAYATLAIPSLDGFTGLNNSEWIDTYVDLTEYKGENIQFRFRFATDGMNVTNAQAWFIDDVEILDLLKYTEEACVIADDGTNACSSATTLINSDSTIGTEDDELAENVNMQIYPNPASDYASIKLSADQKYDARLTVMSMNGAAIYEQDVSLNHNLEIININTVEFPKGFYFVRLESGNAVLTKKLIIQ